MAVASTGSGATIRNALGIRNYRLLCAGQAASLLGEQVNIVALSWLALQVTGDALALGSMLAVAGLPPALLMLVSGLVTDRTSARTTLLGAESLRFVLVAAVVALTLAGRVSTPALYAIALAYGILTALAMPAIGSIVPALVPRALLQPANSLFMGLAQFAAFAGPLVAGLVIAGNQPAASNPTSTGFAFALYAIALAISVVTLLLMRKPAARPPRRVPGAASALVGIVEGWRYTWRDPLLRLVLPAILGLNLLLTGPLTVGIPLLARERLPQGAAAYGLVAAGWGAGNLLGALAAGLFRQSRGLRALWPALFLAFGAGLAALAAINTTWLGFAVLVLMGTGNGYLGVILRTLLHRRTPPELLGRVMSVFLLARTLLVPLSQTLSGAAAKVSLGVMFAGAGVLLALLALWVAGSAGPRLFEQEVTGARDQMPSPT